MPRAGRRTRHAGARVRGTRGLFAPSCRVQGGARGTPALGYVEPGTLPDTRNQGNRVGVARHICPSLVRWAADPTVPRQVVATGAGGPGRGPRRIRRRRAELAGLRGRIPAKPGGVFGAWPAFRPPVPGSAVSWRGPAGPAAGRWSRAGRWLSAARGGGFACGGSCGVSFVGVGGRGVVGAGVRRSRSRRVGSRRLGAGRAVACVRRRCRRCRRVVCRPGLSGPRRVRVSGSAGSGRLTLTPGCEGNRPRLSGAAEVARQNQGRTAARRVHKEEARTMPRYRPDPNQPADCHVLRPSLVQIAPTSVDHSLVPRSWSSSLRRKLNSSGRLTTQTARWPAFCSLGLLAGLPWYLPGRDLHTRTAVPGLIVPSFLAHEEPHMRRLMAQSSTRPVPGQTYHGRDYRTPP